MKIFISYRRADSAYVVDRIRARLSEALGHESIFRDIENIPLGSDFRAVLENETRGCDVMLVVIGPMWADVTDSKGDKRLFDPHDFTRIEVETGLERGIPVIPVAVMGLDLQQMPTAQELPESLRELTFKQGIRIRKDPDFDGDMQRLINDINQLPGGGIEVEKNEFEPELAYIPEGEFWMGSPAGDGIPTYESPQVEVHLPAYRISIAPVTNAQFEEYIRQTDKSAHAALGWDGQRVPFGMGEHPVTGVNWYEAFDFCKWLSKESAHNYSLPNEAQWEKACRGGNNYRYPWGNEFEPQRSNQGNGQLAAVWAYAAQNDFGCFDLVGNVRQWTCTLWGERRIAPDQKFSGPWKDDRRNDQTGNSQIWRVVRGSSYLDGIEQLRCSARDRQLPSERGFPGKRYGFRVARND